SLDQTAADADLDASEIDERAVGGRTTRELPLAAEGTIFPLSVISNVNLFEMRDSFAVAIADSFLLVGGGRPPDLLRTNAQSSPFRWFLCDNAPVTRLFCWIAIACGGCSFHVAAVDVHDGLTPDLAPPWIDVVPEDGSADSSTAHDQLPP